MRWFAALLLSSVVLAQSPAYEFKGKPIQIAGTCKADDLNTLNLLCTAAEPCHLFLELADVEQVGNRILVSGNLHTEANTVESVLLASEDSGATWIEPTGRIPGAILDETQFFDFENGWISGHLMAPRPRDPFFLLSSDGGKTWRRRPMSGEPGPGAVQQFRFDSRQHGLAVLDRLSKGESGMRYEVYESMTGGDSWMLQRLTDQPVSLNIPDRSNLLRIRVDSATKSYRIERRGGTSWAPVSSFSIAAGECRVAPAAELEPPPPPEEVAPSKPAPTAPAPSLQKKRKP